VAVGTALEIVPVPIASSQTLTVVPPVESSIAVVVGRGRYTVKLREGFSMSAFRQVLKVLEVG